MIRLKTIKVSNLKRTINYIVLVLLIQIVSSCSGDDDEIS